MRFTPTSSPSDVAVKSYCLGDATELFLSTSMAGRSPLSSINAESTRRLRRSKWVVCHMIWGIETGTQQNRVASVASNPRTDLPIGRFAQEFSNDTKSSYAGADFPSTDHNLD